MEGNQTFQHADFEFGLNQVVRIKESGETGTVKGRAEYTTSESSYFITFKAADGRAVRDWWPASELEAV